MAQFKSTPGPWRVSGNWVETDDVLIAKIINCKPGSGTHLANKQIIAAAPEMLEALIKCADALDEVSYQSWCGEIIDEARAAIAKATGETK